MIWPAPNNLFYTSRADNVFICISKLPNDDTFELHCLASSFDRISPMARSQDWPEPESKLSVQLSISPQIFYESSISRAMSCGNHKLTPAYKQVS